jgi:hypothetical protein
MKGKNAMYSQVEEIRNRLLRRADWRFLLVNPHPARSVCFSSGLLAQALQTVSAQWVPPGEVSPGECDLAVAANPAPATLHSAWQALRPGGNFYGEWYSPLVGGARGVRQRLEAAGFTDVTCYWPWPVPEFSPTLFWLPLEAPQAVRYFLSNRPRLASPLASLSRSALQILWSVAWRTRLLAPVCAIARKPIGDVNQAGSHAPPSSLQDKILARWSSWGFRGMPSRLDWLLWTGGKRSVNKVVGYVFASGEDQPHMVVKLPRSPESLPGLTHEVEILQALQSKKGTVGVHIPTVLSVQDWGGMPAVCETVVPGQPLYTFLRQDNFFELALNVTDWLASLAAGESLRPRRAWWNRIVEPALEDFTLSFASVLDASVLRACRTLLEQLGDLPQVCEHRDCSPWNLLLTSAGEVAVLDWESAELDGLPGLDLAYFLAYSAFFVEKAIQTGQMLEVYRRAADPATSTGRVQAECQRRYIDCTGLDAAALRPLRLLAWLIHSRSDYHHLVADAGGIPQTAALRSSLFYNLVLEELVPVQAVKK